MNGHEIFDWSESYWYFCVSVLQKSKTKVGEISSFDRIIITDRWTRMREQSTIAFVLSYFASILVLSASIRSFLRRFFHWWIRLCRKLPWSLLSRMGAMLFSTIMHVCLRQARPAIVSFLYQFSLAEDAKIQAYFANRRSSIFLFMWW